MTQLIFIMIQSCITSRLAALLFVLIACTHVASSQAFISIDSAPAVPCASDHSLLASVPQQWWGTTVEATLNTTGGYSIVSINDEQLNDRSQYSFADITAGKEWKVTVMTPAGETVNYTLQFTTLPIVLITGNFGYDYAAGTVAIAEPGMPLTEMMNARIKWRGGTTNAESKHKRNYSIKFVDSNGEKMNRKLLGLRRDNHWILDAGQADMARVRNRVATDLWLDMARPPHYIDKAPDALTGARGKVVEVFLGDDYRGIYCLGEAIDRKQLQLVKHDTVNNVFHGGLWKTDDFNPVTGFKENPPFNDSLPDYYKFTTKYPEFDEVFPTSYQVLYDAVDAMWWSEAVQIYNVRAEKHFDMPVMIDYTIFYITLDANDNSCKNIYWLCHDRVADKRLSLAVWDLDATVGQSWSPSEWRPPITNPDYFNQPYVWVFKMLLHNKCKFRQAFLDRYDELRQSWLSTESLIDRYTTAIDQLINSGAAAREQKRWNGDTDLFGHDLDFEAEKQYIARWFTERMPLLDVWMHHHICDVNFDGYVNSADITAIYNHVLNNTGYNVNFDTNFDGFINVADITGIFNVVLGK